MFRSTVRRFKALIATTRAAGFGFLVGTLVELSKSALLYLAPFVRPYRHLRIATVKPLVTIWQQRYLRARSETICSQAIRQSSQIFERIGLSASDYLASDDCIVLADIDQDGFFVPKVSGLTRLPIKSREEALPRLRYELTLVAYRGTVGIRKQFGSDKHAFTREAYALFRLRKSGCNIPHILGIDFDHHVLVMSFIPGQVLREAIANKGVRLRDCDRPESHEGHSVDMHDHVVASKHVLHEVVTPGFISDLYDQIRIMHSYKFLLGDLKYGNVIIGAEDMKPYLIDLESASELREVPDILFPLFVSNDIERFDNLFGTEHITVRRLGNQVASLERSRSSLWYSPAILGLGYHFGNVLDIGAGYGRWRFLLRKQFPDPKGKRVLDLGANNAFYGIQLLRQGAAEVLSVERDSSYFGQGLFLREAFELLDNRARYNLNYVQGDMFDIMHRDLGRFDFAMALCCLYYLDDERIRRLVARMASMTDIFIVQCNEDKSIPRDDAQTFRKAAVAYNLQVLHENGFIETRVVAPPGYDRPLIIASTS